MRSIMQASSREATECRDLEQTYTMLAEHEEWMAVHIDKTIQRRKNCDSRTALAEEEEQILLPLGAAMFMQWNTVPTKLERELFDCASTIGDLRQTTPLKATPSSNRISAKFLDPPLFSNVLHPT